MAQALATKYRPKTFSEVCSQESIIRILQNQIDTETFKQAYIFTGPAGCGKTTCARILANEINKGQGNPIELDAASNNSVENIRDITAQAKTKSLDSEYKVFILDEVHMLSGGAWAAMLKLIEEPPAKTIFILATTDIQKVPKTILSRCQRFDFHKIPLDIILKRLQYICNKEAVDMTGVVEDEALEYIAKAADGGMRDAITMLDKCLSFSPELTIQNVISALGSVDYETMFKLTNDLFHGFHGEIMAIIEELYMSGKDLKQFIKAYLSFVLDVCKYMCTNDFNLIQIPRMYKEAMDDYKVIKVPLTELMSMLVRLNADIKYESNPKALIEANMLLFGRE